MYIQLDILHYLLPVKVCFKSKVEIRHRGYDYPPFVSSCLFRSCLRRRRSFHPSQCVSSSSRSSFTGFLSYSKLSLLVFICLYGIKRAKSPAVCSFSAIKRSFKNMPADDDCCCCCCLYQFLKEWLNQINLRWNKKMNLDKKGRGGWPKYKWQL